VKTRWILIAALLVTPAISQAAKTSARPVRHAHAATHPKVSADAARTVALAEVPGGRIKSQELEREHGHLIYSFDIAVAGKPGIEEVHVDAMTAKVLAHEHETTKSEQKEKVLEKEEAAGHH
jgi:uncharacterized membrane protein YkoI